MQRLICRYFVYLAIAPILFSYSCASDQQQFDDSLNSNEEQQGMDEEDFSEENAASFGTGNVAEENGGEGMNNAPDEDFANQGDEQIPNNAAGDEMWQNQGEAVNNYALGQQNGANDQESQVINGDTQEQVPLNNVAVGEQGINESYEGEQVATTNQAFPPMNEAGGESEPPEPASEVIEDSYAGYQAGGMVFYVLPGGAPIYDQPGGSIIGNLEQGDHPLVWFGN